MVWYVLLAVAVAIAAWFFYTKTQQAKEGGFLLEDWKPRAMRPLTRAELKVFNHIRTAVPECFLFPQVSLSRFVKVRQTKSYNQWFQRVGRRSVDFLVCSDSGDVLGVLELKNGSTHRDSSGQLRKEKTLKLASIPVWHIDTERLPDHEKLRDMILIELKAAYEHSVQTPEWRKTEIAPRAAGVEAAELEDDDRWNQPWPTEESRPTAFLDNLDNPDSGRTPLTPEEPRSPYDGRNPPN
jgi:hypothetical protein